MLRSHKCNIQVMLLAFMGSSIASCASTAQLFPPKCDCPAAPKATAPALARERGAYEIQPGGIIGTWVVLGPFPNPEREGQRRGIDTDYLNVIGGETKAFIAPGLQLEPVGETQAPLAAKLAAAPDGHINFENILGKLDQKTAYAMARLDSARDQLVRFYLGSDDGARVWVNGEPVFRVVTRGRPLIRGQDRFKARLHRGKNSILVKVEQGTGDWGFVLQAFDEQGYQTVQRKYDVAKALVSGSIAPKLKWDCMFSTEAFPELTWKFSDNSAEETASPQLQVRWFNSRFEEEAQPSGPGRYIAYAEGRVADTIVRRAQTFFARPKEWKPWREKNEAFMHFSSEAPFDPHALSERKDVIADSLGQGIIQFLETGEEGAVIASYLHEAKPTGKKPHHLDVPSIVNSEAQIELRRKLLGLAPPVALRPPEHLAQAAPVIQIGSSAQAGIKPAAVKMIQATVRAWYEDSKEPFVVALSRNGTLFYHEAFGNVSKQTRFPLASITKFIAGILIGRFMDQGLVQLDDAVGKHLPDWPKTGPKAVTIRQCYTHTSGLGALGDVTPDGPWLDNQLLNAIDIIEPGKRFEYNGYGYHLAGKIMESISGKSVPRLVYEEIFEPIGGTPVGPPILGYSVESTAIDLARLGQLALNHGSYGNKKLFSEVTFNALMPRSLHDFYPVLDPNLKVGIGIDGMTEKDPRAGANGFPEGKVLLSPNTIGHGAGSSTVFRVDLDHQLVVAVARRDAGKDYERHLLEFLQAVDDAIR